MLCGSLMYDIAVLCIMFGGARGSSRHPLLLLWLSLPGICSRPCARVVIANSDAHIMRSRYTTREQSFRSYTFSSQISH